MLESAALLGADSVVYEWPESYLAAFLFLSVSVYIHGFFLRMLDARLYFTLHCAMRFLQPEGGIQVAVRAPPDLKQHAAKLLAHIRRSLMRMSLSLVRYRSSLSLP